MEPELQHDRLSISKVVAEQFGGLTDEVVDIGDAPFVVIAGTNEAGKTTLAELVTWLLAGPRGSAVEAARFGDPNSKLTGRLEGSFRNQEIEASGEFVPKQKAVAGAGAKSSIQARMGPESLVDDRWFERIQIDRTTMGAVYRLWGADLHDGGDVAMHLEQVALTGFGGVRDPGKVLDGLEGDAKVITGAAAGSFKSTQDVVRAIEGEIGDALRNTDDYLHKVADIEAAQRSVDELHEQMADLERTVRAAKAALDVSEARREADAADELLQGLPAVSEAWSSIDRERAASLIEAARSDEGNARRLHAEASDALAKAGLRDVDAAGLTATNADVLDAVARAAAVENAAVRVRETQAEVTTARDRRMLDAEAFASALAPIGGDEAEVRAAQLTDADADVLVGSVKDWRSASSAVDSLRSRVEEADRAVAAAERERGDRQAAWDRWATGLGPEAVLIRGERPVQAAVEAPPKQARSVAPIAVVGLAAVVAAVVARSWVVAGVAVVATVIAIVWARLAPSSGVQADAVAPVSPDLLRDGGALRDAIGRFEAAVRDRDGKADELRAAIEKLDSNIAEAAAAFSSRGLPVPADPDEAEVSIENWRTARRSLLAVDAATAALAQAESKESTAVESLREKERELASLVQGIGIGVAVSPAAAQAVVQAASDAVDAHRQAMAAEERAKSARSELAAVLSAVTSEISGLGDQAILDEIERVGSVVDERTKIIDRRQMSRSEIRARLTDVPRAQKFIDAGLDEVELELRKNRATADHEDATEQARLLSEEVGGLKKERDELASEEHLADLRLRLGAARERSEETLIDGVVAAFASSLLTEIRDQYERDNQPAIVARAAEVLAATAEGFGAPIVRRDDASNLVVEVDRGAKRVPAARLSTGARALLYLAFRIALAETDAANRGRRMPLICDDPLVHIDDARAAAAVRILAEAARAGNQVLLFTCHERTVLAARDAGATVVRLGAGDAAGGSGA